MLSVLIPCYNCDITNLVNELQRQLSALSIMYEVIVIEDASNLFLKENLSIESMQFITYIQLEKNIGRAKIRNLLSETAKYPYLLFLDCDTALYNKDFIKNYLIYCKKNCIVIGGTTYDDNFCSNCSLAHKYGSKRERFDAKNIKNKEKYNIFTTPNFLIYKDIFERVKFDETLTDYGHEDTLFGLQLAKEGFKFVCIDNPVIHKGLDTNINYLKKTDTALQTLFKIYQSGKYPELMQVSKIIHYFNFIKKIKMKYFVKKLFLIFKTLLVKNLTGKNPSLLLFDAYKLGYFCTL
jgi:cellulose synthase/poly-beta-1,6-N-acetylglucosamine synthase-like glycosyltransferase